MDNTFVWIIAFAVAVTCGLFSAKLAGDKGRSPVGYGLLRVLPAPDRHHRRRGGTQEAVARPAHSGLIAGGRAPGRPTSSGIPSSGPRVS